jgi:hypothetical protein
VNETLVKYLAGLMDADGSLSFAFKKCDARPSEHYVGLYLSLASSDAVDDQGFIDDLPELTKMGSLNRYGARKQFKSWVVSKRSDLEMLLPRLIKHMVIKARHWQWLLDEWRKLRIKSNTVSTGIMDELKQSSKDSRKSRVGPIKPKNHPTWAWVAGYLDGDGWYSYRSGVYNGYRQFTISCGAVAHKNDMSVLLFLQNAFGGYVRLQGQAPDVYVWKRSLGYQNRSFALDFLPRVAKHSRLKRKKIDAIIHHHRQRLSVPGTEKNFCKEDGCERPAHGNGLCNMHYLRDYRKVQATV